MKRTILIMTLSFFALMVKAQNDAISKFFNKYEDDEDFTHVTVTARMFGLFANLDAEEQEDKDLLDAISKVKGLKILAKDDTSDGRELYKEAFKLIPSKDYDELMSIRDKDNDMKFLIKEKDGIINELLMVVGGDNQFLILSLVGDIDLKQISRLSKSMDIEGFEKLKNLDKDHHNDNDH